MGLIAGKATVNLCTLFCSVGGIVCMDDTKHAVNAFILVVLQQGKIKALHPQQMQGKRKARPFLTG